MSTDPCEDRPTAPDHLVWDGRLYDVDGVTVVDTEDGSTLLEVWATERGGEIGQPE